MTPPNSTNPPRPRSHRILTHGLGNGLAETYSERHHTTDVNQAMVEQQFGTVRVLLNPMPCYRKSIQSNSMI